MATKKYRYRVTGPQGGQYLTTTRSEAEKLTRHGGSFRAVGQKKASRVKNPKLRWISIGSKMGGVLSTPDMRFHLWKTSRGKWAVDDVGLLLGTFATKKAAQAAAEKARQKKASKVKKYRKTSNPRVDALVISGTAHQTGYGSDSHKRVTGLSSKEREHVKRGGLVAYESEGLSGGSHGTFWRIVIKGTHRDYYPRVPSDAQLRRIERRGGKRNPAAHIVGHNDHYLVKGDVALFRYHDVPYTVVSPNNVLDYVNDGYDNQLFDVTLAMFAPKILVFGHGIEDAIEEAAGWAADHAPGVFNDDETVAEAEAEGWIEDLSYTESGYLTSHEMYFSEVHDPALIAEAIGAAAEWYAQTWDMDYEDKVAVGDAIRKLRKAAA